MTFDLRDGLDSIDWKLLCELEGNARLSFSELGRRVGLSQPATAERVKALEASGIIRGYRLDVDERRLGFPILAFIQVNTEREETYARLLRFTPKQAEILEHHRVTGDVSSILRVAVRSTDHLEQLIDKLMQFGGLSTSLILSSPVGPRSPVTPRAVSPSGRPG